MEDITTGTKISRNWHKPSIDNKTSGKEILRPNKPQDRAPLKCHASGITYHLANNCAKKTRINRIGIEKSEYTKGTIDLSVHESDSEPSEEKELPYQLSMETINLSFEVTQMHTHFPKYSEECMDLIHVKNAKIHKLKPARGNSYTSGSSCIPNVRTLLM
ncbi:hypothetical protein O181_020464 [Austropuccinia psidii MF-1]|uniref:Uncharacterized protein n=1 Tax=Austropuccinia psidii MF-1 TaxID=1389203 RepID=A0A9Q3C8Z6_9BASI|nr:hypothetical protein [Austropuccinia psidii MF-1]